MGTIELFSTSRGSSYAKVSYSTQPKIIASDTVLLISCSGTDVYADLYQHWKITELCHIYCYRCV